MSASAVRPVAEVLDESAAMLAAQPKIRLHVHPSSIADLDPYHPGLADPVTLVEDPAVAQGYAYIECTDCPDAEPVEQPAAIPDRWYVMHEHTTDGVTEAHAHPAGVAHPSGTNAEHAGVGVASWEDLRIQLAQDVE